MTDGGTTVRDAIRVKTSVFQAAVNAQRVLGQPEFEIKILPIQQLRIAQEFLEMLHTLSSNCSRSVRHSTRLPSYRTPPCSLGYRIYGRSSRGSQDHPDRAGGSLGGRPRSSVRSAPGEVELSMRETRNGPMIRSILVIAPERDCVGLDLPQHLRCIKGLCISDGCGWCFAHSRAPHNETCWMIRE